MNLISQTEVNGQVVDIIYDTIENKTLLDRYLIKDLIDIGSSGSIYNVCDM